MKMEVLKIKKLERYESGNIKRRQKAIVKGLNKEIIVQVFNNEDFLEIEGKEIFAKIINVNGTNYIKSYLMKEV